MATLDLSTSRLAFSMTDRGDVGFNRAYQTDPTSWLFNTPDLHAVRLTGNGLTYDAEGRAQTGLVNRIEIDLGNDYPADPDVTITGISASAPRLDDGPGEFWHVLQGNDVILAPDSAKGAARVHVALSGDGPSAPAGRGGGGHDVIHAGDGGASIAGDVFLVGNRTVASPTSTYVGGDDQILGQVATVQHLLTGDAGIVNPGSRLVGGDDTILIQSTSRDAIAIGDANLVSGLKDEVAAVVGGDDDISAGLNFRGWLAGDVNIQRAYSLVRGGGDMISGGELGELITGDVHTVEGGALVGGDDTLIGNGGDDRIFGDAYDVLAYDALTGGDDLIRGGAGDDILVGDFDELGSTSDGDDRLYGDEGNDRLYGEGGSDDLNGGSGNDLLVGGAGDDSLFGGSQNDQLEGGAGNDLLDGGSGADRMNGQTGDDVYFVNDQLDIVYEFAGGGHDTVVSSLSAWRLRGDAEDLSYIGSGNFTGIGNSLTNTIRGGAGADDLRGEDGDDILIGGAGADVLVGGFGVDTASYATASRGVWAVLTGSPSGQGTDAAGDTYVGVENLAGSVHGDILQGDDLANTLSGGAGDDQLSGFGGNDILIGGIGGEYLLGGDGADVLRGGNGFDILYAGRDADVFDFNRAGESGPGAARDVIRSLNTNVRAFEGAGVAGGDVIDLAGIDANTGAGGNQAFIFGGTGRGRVSVVEAGGNSLVRANTDGDAAFEFELLIEDGGVLASAYGAGDFIL